VGHPKIDQPERAADTAAGAAPLRDGEGQVIAALNVTVHAAETPIEVLTGEYLPLLLQTAGAISADWAACEAASQLVRPGTGRVFAERTG
jgi:DNA-binding IclR family transcriptional regulator